MLEQLGLALPYAPVAVLLEWPLVAVGSAADAPGVHGISGFVDRNPAYPNALLDYACGNRTYDLPDGYNHTGIDIFTWPFAWTWVASSEVEVVAAAEGTIVYKHDGSPDQNCGPSLEEANSVWIEHFDGSLAGYVHLKNGSVTGKPVGGFVTTGETLGVVASSGYSYGPHLHFELIDPMGYVIEPFVGVCNPVVSSPRWKHQPPYYDPRVNRLTVGPAPAEFPPCPGLEIPNDAAAIAKGQVAYFTTYYRDQLIGQPSEYRILRPNGTPFQSWTHSLSSTFHAAAAWWWWSYYVPTGEPSGTWAFEVTFDGHVESHAFVVN